MPALDYVSIIRSVYVDRRAMLAGVFASALTAGLTGYKSHSPLLYGVAIAFIIIGIIRYFDMRAFWRASIDSDDAEAAEHWENRAVVSGSMLAAVYGFWCLVSMAVVKDPYAELASASISIAVMVGICARNFGLDRLVTIQMLFVIVPLSLGYALHGDVYHFILAALLGVMLSSFRKLAGDIRGILLSAVHGRVEASRLAAELDMAMSTMQHGLCLLDEAGMISVANEPAARIFSLLDVPTLIGRPFRDLLGQLSANGQLPRTAVDRLLDTISRQGSGKVLLCLPEGRYYEVTVSSRRERCVLLFEDISERVEAEERINFMARHDALTDLPNRAYFSESVADDLALRGETPAGDPLRSVMLMIVDVDDFKHVNDTLGHLIGDKLLAEIARRLKAAIPSGAILARLGGDEFIVYRPQVADDQQAARDAEAIRQAFCAPFDLDGVRVPANASVGYVVSDGREDDLEGLMTKADLALYSAKGSGKARTQVFHAQMDVDYQYRQQLKTDLSEAVRSGGLSLAFQPLLDIKSRKVVTCEALARWTHPEFGTVPPAVFIPIAEEMGIISEITAWVLEMAARECASWPGNVGVAVNISARDFRGGDVRGMVNHALLSSGLAPDRLELEVTETAVIEEREIAQAVLDELAEQGICIALDDFGTGYSSLSYLGAFPFAKLKIDRSFVADIATDEKALKLLANVARLGRDLDLVVIAEGVETEEQLAAMTANTGIEQVQGYLFSRPLPPRDIAELICRLNAVPAMTGKSRKHG